MSSLAPMKTFADDVARLFAETTVLRNPTWMLSSSKRPLVFGLDSLAEPRSIFRANSINRHLSLHQRLFIALFAGGDYGPGVFGRFDAPQTADDRGHRADLVEHVARAPLEGTAGALLSEALVSALREGLAAPLEDQEILLAQIKHDWLPIVSAQVSDCLGDHDLDLDGLFELDVLRLYLQPVACTSQELHIGRRPARQDLSLALLAEWTRSHLAAADVLARRQRRLLAIVRGIVGADMFRRGSPRDAWSVASEPKDTVASPLAARWSVDRTKLTVAVDATPILAFFEDSLDDPVVAFELVGVREDSVDSAWLEAAASCAALKTRVGPATSKRSVLRPLKSRTPLTLGPETSPSKQTVRLASRLARLRALV